MTTINYNEFQAGQGVSAPDLNENFSLTNDAIEDMEQTLNSAISSLTSTTNLKANKNGSSAEKFNVADATENTNAVSFGQLNTLLTPLSPVGTVIWYAGSSAPTGYLLCDGSAVSRTTYATLFGIVGVKFGAGDSATTFNLPNLIDKFIEGSTVSGTVKNAGLPNITGQFGSSSYGHKIDNPSGAFSSSGSTYDKPPYTDTSGGSILKFKASSSNSIYGNSSTVQPPALTMLPCIKY